MCIRDREDIDTALCAWNGNIESKHAVVRYMKDHAREKDTAEMCIRDRNRERRC